MQMKSVSSPQTFCKTTRCPSSETLLRYRRHLVTIRERLSIDKHLRDCDFCSAELQLLKRHGSEYEDDRTAEMPLNLRQFAATLLGKTTYLKHLGGFTTCGGQLSH